MLCPDYVPDFDFNPLPRKEGDRVRCGCLLFWSDFNPLPRKEGDARIADASLGHGFQSTPS